jgi:alkanesulfonate monooxygenase
MPSFDIRLFATFPRSKEVVAAEYRERVAAVAGWSEDVGFARILVSEILISGSSVAGLAAAQVIGATLVKYPEANGEERPPERGAPRIRVGIIPREDAGEAWGIEERRFLEDRTGQIAHEPAMRVSDSQWHLEPLDPGAQSKDGQSPYWFRPFENFKTFCAVFVGSYYVVADELARYLDVGFTTFGLPIGPSEDELRHTAVVLERAHRRTRAVGGPVR